VSKIDWSKAPEWADGRGLVAHHGITEVWINMDQYAVVGAEDRAYPYGGGTGDHRHNFTRDQVQYITARPDRWDGEGLPPVGALVEASFACEDFENWHDGICVAVGEDPEGREEFCVVQCGKKIAMYRDEARRVRPRRSLEQIKAEEREKAIVEMAETMHAATGFGVNRADCEALYDAGYRKQVAP